MNTYQKIYFLIFSLWFFISPLSGKDFRWHPVSEKDWEVSVDSSKEVFNAVMIFEEVVANHKDLGYDKVYHTIYRRIRILSEEGRKHADVKVPYVNKKQKIEEIKGRVVLRDGTTIPLEKSRILEKDVFKTKKIKIKEKSFSLAGVTDDCIIEYMIRYRLPGPESVWLIEKDISMLEGRFTWEFYRGSGLTSYIYNSVSDFVTPNFLWLYSKYPVDVQYLPSPEDPKRVVFTVKQTDPFKAEPQSLPEIALKAQLRYYYSSRESIGAYWRKLEARMSTQYAEFAKKKKRVADIIAAFDTLSSNRKKIRAVYNWILENVENTNYVVDEKDGKKYKENYYVDEVLKRGYGSGWDINVLFCSMLREMNIDARMVLAVDRDENILAKQAKYWQFDRTLVAVANAQDYFSYYCPGNPYLQAGMVPWYNEGVAAFIVDWELAELSYEELEAFTSSDIEPDQFGTVNFSKPRTNSITCIQKLTLDEEFQANGTMAIHNKGHHAFILRNLLSDASEQDRTDYLKEEMAVIFPNTDIDSLEISGLDDRGTTVITEYQIGYESIGQPMGNRVMIKPYEMFSKEENPFQAENRQYPIIFEHAYQTIETIHLSLPENWIVEALPSDTVFYNKAGQCQISFKTFDEDKTISIQRLFKLNNAFFNPKEYPEVQEIFKAQKSFEDITLLVKETDEEAQVE